MNLKDIKESIKNYEVDFAVKVADEYLWLISRVEALEEALQFYADPETYFAAIVVLPDRPCGDFVNDFSLTKCGMRPGAKARKALEDKND